MSDNKNDELYVCANIENCTYKDNCRFRKPSKIPSGLKAVNFECEYEPHLGNLVKFFGIEESNKNDELKTCPACKEHTKRFGQTIAKRRGRDEI